MEHIDVMHPEDLWAVACRGKHTKNQLLELRAKKQSSPVLKKPAAVAPSESECESLRLSDPDETGDLLLGSTSS